MAEAGPPARNRASSLLSREHNEKIFSLLRPRCKTLAMTLVHLAVSSVGTDIHFIRKDRDILCLVKDYNQRNYFFSLYSVRTNSLIWERSILDVQYTGAINIFKVNSVSFYFLSVQEAGEMKNIVEEIVLRVRKRKKGHTDRQDTLDLSAVSQLAPKLKSSKSTIKKVSKLDIGVPLEFKHMNSVSFDPNSGFDTRTWQNDFNDTPNLTNIQNTAKYTTDYIAELFNKPKLTEAAVDNVAIIIAELGGIAQFTALELQTSSTSNIDKQSELQSKMTTILNMQKQDYGKGFKRVTLEDPMIRNILEMAGVSKQQLDKATKQFVLDFIQGAQSKSLVKLDRKNLPPPPPVPPKKNLMTNVGIDKSNLVELQARVATILNMQERGYGKEYNLIDLEDPMIKNILKVAGITKQQADDKATKQFIIDFLMVNYPIELLYKLDLVHLPPSPPLPPEKRNLMTNVEAAPLNAVDNFGLNNYAVVDSSTSEDLEGATFHITDENNASPLEDCKNISRNQSDTQDQDSNTLVKILITALAHRARAFNSDDGEES